MEHPLLEQARGDLATYCAALYKQFALPRHLAKLVETLTAVERGEVRRVIVAMPPRHGKSFITSQLFPSWFLGRNPTKSIIASSYGQELASDFGRRVRNFCSERLYRQIFPDCVISDDSDAVHRFHTTAGGAYYAVGAGGPITGRGADLLLIDDPIKSREDASSAAYRRTLQDWYQHVAYPRLEPNGAIVIIATRWHQDDLIGWLLREHAAEGWQVISMPAIAEVDEGWRQEGAALWPERFPLGTLAQIREAIGGSAWAALYQCRPAPEEGAIFKRDWFLAYPASAPPECTQRIVSIDTAFKTGESNDYSVIQVWGQTKVGYALLNQWRERKEFGDLMRQAVAMGEAWSPNYVLVEDAASGQSLIQMMRNETRLPLLPVRPLGDKVARAHAVSPLVESGRVFLPDQASWLRDFLDEVTSFPAAPHDDQVDAMTQALNYLRENQYEPFRYTPPRHDLVQSRFDARRSSGVRGLCDAQDAIDDARGDPTHFVTGPQSSPLSARAGDRWRYGSLSRRKAW